jgi:hypothetical protein
MMTTLQTRDEKWAVIDSAGQEIHRFETELLAITMASALSRESAPSVTPAGRWTQPATNAIYVDWCPECNGDGYVSQRGPYTDRCEGCRGTGLVETDFPAADRHDAARDWTSVGGDSIRGSEREPEACAPQEHPPDAMTCRDSSTPRPEAPTHRAHRGADRSELAGEPISHRDADGQRQPAATATRAVQAPNALGADNRSVRTVALGLEAHTATTAFRGNPPAEIDRTDDPTYRGDSVSQRPGDLSTLASCIKFTLETETP